MLQGMRDGWVTSEDNEPLFQAPVKDKKTSVCTTIQSCD